MSMATGARLGPYRIEGPLGAGGMGEVYRASDSRLGRDVALKVLPEHFASDPERLGRFAREAQVLAALNHPHIAAIYGLEESGPSKCLVLEYVQGETLAERIKAGPLPMEDALLIARQIAEGLEAAHERGIVHRDLKPANIKITPEGAVKILDFGLAKALESEVTITDLSHSPTLTTPATRLGVIMGTAAYMSPEQARGREVDRRADIWAFGCVLYEMLTGRQAFSGETVSDIMASILKVDADLRALPAALPAAVRRLVERCLTRDARQRLRDIGEARLIIDDVLSGRTPADAAVPAAPAPPSLSRAVLAGAVLATALIAAAAAWYLKPAAAPAGVRKFDFAIENLNNLNSDRSPRISPDGRRFIYAAGGKFWLRDLEQFEPRQLSSDPGARYFFWSPDSQWVGYFSDGRLWKVSVSGGAPMVITTSGEFGGGAGATWSEKGEIIFSRGNAGLLAASAQGAETRPFLDLEPDSQDHHEPHALPGGAGVLYVAHRRDSGPDTLVAYDGKQRKKLLELAGAGIWSPAYSPSGHIVFRRVGSNPGLWALPFSLSKLEATGEPFLIVNDGDTPSVARDGTLLMQRGLGTGTLQFVRVDATGKTLGRVGLPQQWLGYPDISPDGNVMVAAVSEQDNRDIWLFDLRRGTRTRFSFDPATDVEPAWSRDGRLVVFSRASTQLIMKSADGTGPEQPLGPGQSPHFSHDGKLLVYAQVGKDTLSDIWYMPMTGDRKPVPFLHTPAHEELPALSPDGKYLAYVSSESGRQEVYLTRFPSAEGKWQVSASGGNFPRWSQKGDRLFYRAGNQDLMQVSVDTRGVLNLGTPQVLFQTRELGLVIEGAFRFAPMRDGKEFIAVQAVAEANRTSRVTIVQNWAAEYQDKR